MAKSVTYQNKPETDEEWENLWKELTVEKNLLKPLINPSGRHVAYEANDGVIYYGYATKMRTIHINFYLGDNQSTEALDDLLRPEDGWIGPGARKRFLDWLLGEDKDKSE